MSLLVPCGCSGWDSCQEMKLDSGIPLALLGAGVPWEGSAVPSPPWVVQLMVCTICQPSDLPLSLLTIPCPKPLHHSHSKPFPGTNLFSGVLNTNQLPSPLNRATLNSTAEITGFCQHRTIKFPEWPSPRSVYPKLQLPLRASLRKGGNQEKAAPPQGRSNWDNPGRALISTHLCP